MRHLTLCLVLIGCFSWTKEVYSIVGHTILLPGYFCYVRLLVAYYKVVWLGKYTEVQAEPDARNASVGNGDRIKKYGQVLYSYCVCCNSKLGCKMLFNKDDFFYWKECIFCDDMQHLIVGTLYL